MKPSASAKLATSAAVTRPLVERYLDAMWMEKGLSHNTLAAYRHDLDALAGWLDGLGRSLEQADAIALGDYLAHRMAQKISARSTRRGLSCWRGFYHYLIREG